MHHKSVAEKLGQAQRNLLVRHVDGSEFIKPQVDLRGKGYAPTLRSMMDMGLIRYSGWKSVQTTTITEDGRMVLAFLLASYADALIQAGYLVESAGPTPAVAKIAAHIAEPSPAQPQNPAETAHIPE